MGISGMLVFPTRVGMNRESLQTYSASVGVPHTRGDEPLSYGSKL